jgi:hypothetical protein
MESKRLASGEQMGSAVRSLYSLPTASEKTEVRIVIDGELANRVRAMKVKLKTESGVYFSLSQICEIAIESALKQADAQIKKAHSEDDEITSL